MHCKTKDIFPTRLNGNFHGGTRNLIRTDLGVGDLELGKVLEPDNMCEWGANRKPWAGWDYPRPQIFVTVAADSSSGQKCLKHM